jgi:hypothetical protein
VNRQRRTKAPIVARPSRGIGSAEQKLRSSRVLHARRESAAQNKSSDRRAFVTRGVNRQKKIPQPQPPPMQQLGDAQA